MLPMKKLTVLLGVTVVCILLVQPASAAPRLTMPESVFDFGFVPQNSTISHGFWLLSTGDDTLRIIRIKPG
jgi:hypothetical protein